MRTAVIVVVVAVAGWTSAAERWSYVSSQPQLVTRVEGRPGWVLFLGVSPSSFSVAFQQLVRPWGKVVVQCPYFNPSFKPGVRVEVANTLEGAFELARMTGGELVPIGERGLLLTTSDNELCTTTSYLFVAERVAGIGGPMDATLDEEEVAWLLFATSDTDHRMGSKLRTLFWPTHEGGGREFLVLEVWVSTGTQKEEYATLRRVAIQRGDDSLQLLELWPLRGDGHDVPCGRVTDLELDFDDDGVIDVVAFSGLEGNEVGTTPLVIVSGRTGERLGEIEGDELVVTRSATGVKVRTLGTRQDVVAVGDSTYWVETRIQRLYVLEEGELSLAWEREEPGYCALGGPLEPRTGPRDHRVPDIGRPRAADKPLLRPKRETEDLASLAPGEQLLAHVLVADARVLLCFDRGPWHGIAALRRVGEQILWPGKDAPELANARILFEYHPPKPEEHHEP